MSDTLPPKMEPQAALETAARDAIRQAEGYAPAACDRMFDGKPPPKCGDVFVAVWSPANRRNQSRTCLDELFGLNVTVTLRAKIPADNWVPLRDELERRLNRIRALIHRDSLNWSILRKAREQDGRTVDPDNLTRYVGFSEALKFVDLMDAEQAKPWWFGGDGAKTAACGVYQTARFGGARLIQGLEEAV